MKKIISYIILLFVMQSCLEVFDKEPLDKISDSDVWQQESLMRAYISDLYSRFPFIPYPAMEWVDNATNRFGGNNANTNGGVSHTNESGFAFWNYTLIREINTFLDKIDNAAIDPLERTQMKGEVLAMRGIVYYEKMKRYGGVPLIDVVLDPFGEIDEKYLTRAKEEEVYELVDADLAAAIDLLTPNHTPTGRINKWVAQAYRARANLWAASIAKWSTVELDGVVGIPAGRANELYGKAVTAARAVIDSERYQLYNNNADKSENYRYLFLDDSNSEIIFERLYDGITIAHEFSHMNYPTRFSAGQGSHINPLLELLYAYENIDGSATQPEIGPDHLYADGRALWANKDPRLRGSVFLQGEPYAGDIIQTYDGLDPSLVPNPANILQSSTVFYNGVVASGPDSRLSPQDFRTRSGFLLRKYILDEPLVERNTMKTSWKAIRLAEMYLIVAEGEFELQNLGPAATALNATRQRAGISLVDETTITRDILRNEIRVELAFEGFRYWDLRRWRLGESLLQRTEAMQGLRTILHYETGQYYFLPLDAETFTRNYRFEHYYNPITRARMENNILLIENPGYL